MKRNSVAAIFALGTLLCACQQPAVSVHPENQEPPVAQPSPRQAWVENLASNPDFLGKLQHVTGSGLEAAIEKNISKCDNSIVQEHYKSKNYQLITLTDPQKDAKDALTIFDGIAAQGSSFQPPHLDEIQKLYESWSASTTENKALELDENDWKTITKNLDAINFDIDQEDAPQKLIELINSERCSEISPKICQYISDAKSSLASSTDTTAQLDVLLTCDILSWAQKLRLNYKTNIYTVERWKQWINDDTLANVRSRVFLQDLQKSGPRKAITRLTPTDLQYQKLIDARQIYIDAINAGGWPEVKATLQAKQEPKVGKSYPWVPALRSRLAAEKYDAGDLNSDILDESLLASVDLYRELHQLNPKNHIDNTLMKNLAVPPINRLAAIDVTLQRYREAGASTLPYYILVNLPDFYAEVWKGEERLTRFRIVVGNNNIQKDPVTKKPVLDEVTKEPIHPNRTPMITSKMNEIIYNPYWNVPARIRIEELEPKLAQNPNYYIENNYEEVNVGDPKLYYVRELPNPNNSLGLIKFMFPNPYNVYLHDTNAKPVFKNPTRANSHGCMRVSDPFTLAEILLKEDGQWDAAYINRIRTTKPLEQTSIFLKRPVDVVIVYFNTRVDDAGPVAFLSDVYQYDEAPFAKRLDELKKIYNQ